MKLHIQFFIGALFALVIGATSCDVFNDDTESNYVEVAKDIEGAWKLCKVSRNTIDITDAMDFSKFRIKLKKDNTYELNGYLPFIVKKNGTWKVDDPLYPFFLTFQEDDGENEVTTEIKFITVDGKRQLVIDLSPGCYTNKYKYTFEQVVE